MIQTQLLKADKPYQIICAAGMVGVQVATLIVTEDKMAADGSYQIDTHSHPVVNYGNKDGLMEELKYNQGADPDFQSQVMQRLQPEAAVWNKVEVRDIRVLGLIGANNPFIDLEHFVSLVPSIPSDDPSVMPGMPPLWGEKSASKIWNLKFAMERLGLRCCTSTPYVKPDIYDDTVKIYVKFDPSASVEHLVKVMIRDASEYEPYIGNIEFRARLDEDPQAFMNTIVGCMRALDQQFIGAGDKLRFVHHRSSEKDDKWEDLLDRATEHMNSQMWKNRYGIG